MRSGCGNILPKKKFIAGAQYLRALKELYYAKEGSGAFCNDKPIKVVKTPNTDQIVISNGHFNAGNLEDNNPKNLSAMKNQATQSFNELSVLVLL